MIVGHGSKGRAQVVFDDEHWITEAHKKSFHARIYHLYGRSRELLRFVVPCSDKAVARALELKVQGKIGGNQNALHPEVERELYRGLAPDSDARRLLRMAHLSAFSAIRDLYLWRREGLILDPEWEEISERLCLNKRARSGRRAA